MCLKMTVKILCRVDTHMTNRKRIRLYLIMTKNSLNSLNSNKNYLNTFLLQFICCLYPVMDDGQPISFVLIFEITVILNFC